MNKSELKTFYMNQLKNNFIPYWERTIDLEYGGLFTCMTNTGDKKISDIKYVWSQGRFLWLACKLLEMERKEPLSLSPIWEEAANKTYAFLTKYTVMPNNHIVFAVEKDGTQIEGQKDVSIFADCFFVLGCNAFAQYKQDKDIFEKSLVIYRTIKKRLETGEYKSDPYPIPAGFYSHSIPMILLNVSEELLKTAKDSNHDSEKELLQDVRENFNKILNNHMVEERIIEMIPEQEHLNGLLLARHVNPGHTLESIWFMQHSLTHFNNEDQKSHIKKFSKIVKSTLLLGWDNEYGGLFRFIDKDGSPPKGELIGSAFESLIVDTWDTKLWWPHSEALYTTLLFSEITADPFFEEWYEKMETYVFKTFPNTEPSIGEWIQIRNRQGEPIKKVVALPVKDPFHIIRNFIHIIDLLEEEAP